MRVLLRTSKKWKHSRKPEKEINKSKRTEPLENSKMSRIHEIVRDSFPFGYTNLAPLKASVSNERILNCRLHPLLRFSAKDRNHVTVSAFLHACMNDERHCAYVVFDSNHVKHLREAAFPPRTPAALFQVNANPASVDSKWALRLARVYSCETSGYLEAREKQGNHRVYLLVQGFTDEFHFSGLCFKMLGALSSILWWSLAE